MPKGDKQITGAVSIGDRTYTAGQEADFEAALGTEAGESVDLDALEQRGALRGYGKARSAEVRARNEARQTINRQRDPDTGELADPESAAEANPDEIDRAESAGLDEPAVSAKVEGEQEGGGRVDAAGQPLEGEATAEQRAPLAEARNRAAAKSGKRR